MEMVTLRISVPRHVTTHVIDLFESYRGPVSVKAGCRSVQLYSLFSDPGEFMLIEEWGSPAALHDHIRSDDFRKVLALMDLAAKAPDLKFHRVSSAKGFALVAELRHGGMDAEQGWVGRAPDMRNRRAMHPRTGVAKTLGGPGQGAKGREEPAKQ